LVSLSRALLIGKLNRLTVADSRRFDDARRMALAALVFRTTSVEFAVAILGALRFVGTSSQLPLMDQAARGDGLRVPVPGRERVVYAALWASTSLRMRLARELIEGRKR
jgi:hypothetical protein